MPQKNADLEGATRALGEEEDDGAGEGGLEARLEGEKTSLEKLLAMREKEQAQEASELQTSMIETMEATEIEKQRHHSTRMEALVRLAELEVTNAELAKSLAREQWNLEVQACCVFLFHFVCLCHLLTVHVVIHLQFFSNISLSVHMSTFPLYTFFVVVDHIFLRLTQTASLA